MTIMYCIAAVLTIAGGMLIFNITPQDIADAVMSILTPKASIAKESLTARGKRGGNRLYKALMRTKEALVETRNGAKFAIVCSLSVAGVAAGFLLGTLIDNPFIIPVLSLACGSIPFIYAERIVERYRDHIDLELETALSIISTSYIRTDDIVQAMQENMEYLRPPLNSIIGGFIVEATSINPDIPIALRNLREKIDNATWREWCDTLIQCQHDRTMKDSLYSVVSALTDERLINNEMETLMIEARMEYYTMVGLTVLNIPLIYCLNADWYDTLVHTLPGKITLAFVAVVIFVTYLRMLHHTKKIRHE